MIYQNLDSNPNPIVSMIVFTYNQETMVSQTIDSLLAQKTSYPHEIILVDDCSTDKTLDMCLEYYNKYPDLIRVVENDTNKGFMRNYHESISEYARGKYIAPVAGDDWWHAQDKIQKQIDFLESHPDYDMVYSDSLIYLQDQKKIEKYSPCDVDASFLQLMYYNCIVSATACYTKKIFDDYLMYIDPVKQKFVCEDLPLWLWISYKSKIHHVKEPLTTYRELSQSMSHFIDENKRYSFLLETKNIKLFFYKFFKLENSKILHDILLDFYTMTLVQASVVDDIQVLMEREKFFLKEGHFVYYILSKFNRFFSKSRLSSILPYVNKLGLKKHSFKVFGKY